MIYKYHESCVLILIRMQQFHQELRLMRTDLLTLTGAVLRQHILHATFGFIKEEASKTSFMTFCQLFDQHFEELFCNLT